MNRSDPQKPLIRCADAPTVMYLLFGLAVCIAAIGRSEAAVAAGTVLAAVGVAEYLIFYRCPACGRLLGREGGGFCPHCGRSLRSSSKEPPRTLTLPAFAKLNLTLDILGKRPDGYHELRTVMQTVSLHDDVTVTVGGEPGVTCRTEGAELPCDERNLAVKAAKAFLDALGLDCGVSIALTKRIPSEAGMGGGSADAAAVLRALRDLCAPTLADERLEEIGARVGSDVPFCVRGGTQLAEGRGEVLTVLKPAPKLFAAVCKPEFSISTPALFARADSAELATHPDSSAMVRAIGGGDAAALCACVGNAFEQVLDGAQSARVEQIRRTLILHGAKAAAMTGSGSAVFGLFYDEAVCRAACDAMRSENLLTFCTESV